MSNYNIIMYPFSRRRGVPPNRLQMIVGYGLSNSNTCLVPNITCYNMRYTIVLSTIMIYNTLLDYTVICHSTLSYANVLHCSVLYCIAQVLKIVL